MYKIYTYICVIYNLENFNFSIILFLHFYKSNEINDRKNHMIASKKIQ